MTDERRNVALKMMILYSPMSSDMNAPRRADVAAYVVVRAAYTMGSAKRRPEYTILAVLKTTWLIVREIALGRATVVSAEGTSCEKHVRDDRGCGGNVRDRPLAFVRLH